MSIKMMSLVWEHYPGGGAELLMALAYADHAHDDGSCIRPSVAYIARKTRQSERTVSRILAKMRESKWLLMVKRGSGRGFASEYRINPLWITNPDKLAGGSENSQKRVTLEVVNPDTRGMKRVTPVSSQPSRIIKEPALENHRIQNDAAYFFSTGLRWPSVIEITDLPSARKILRGCEPDRQQAVLDELATIARSGSVPRPLGLLKALVDRLEATGQVSRPDRGAAQKPDRSKNRPIEAVLTVEATLVSDGVKTASLRRLAALRDTISQEGLAKRSSERRAG
jgi:hypothetical protein